MTTTKKVFFSIFPPPARYRSQEDSDCWPRIMTKSLQRALSNTDIGGLYWDILWDTRSPLTKVERENLPACTYHDTYQCPRHLLYFVWRPWTLIRVNRVVISLIWEVWYVHSNVRLHSDWTPSELPTLIAHASDLSIRKYPIMFCVWQHHFPTSHMHLNRHLHSDHHLHSDL